MTRILIHPLFLAALLAGWLIGVSADAQSTTAPASATVPSSAPAGIPSGAELARANRLVNELCRKQGPFSSTRDAANLLELARNTSSDSAVQYAASMRALEMAASCNQIDLARLAADDLATGFGVAPLQLKLTIVQRLQAAGHAASATALAMRYVDDALRSRQLDLAAALVRILRNSLANAAEPGKSAIAQQIADYDYAARCLHRPATTQAINDGQARFDFLYLCQYATALSQLAQGSNDAASLASADLAATQTPDRLRIADQWWIVGETAGGKLGWRYASRSVAIYNELFDTLDGVHRELAFTRIALHEREQLAWQGFQPGMICQISGGGNNDRRSATRVPSLDLDSQQADLPPTSPKVFYRGVLLVDLAGRYEFMFAAGTGLRVRIDDELALDNPTAYRKRSGEKLTLELSRGLHPIEVEVYSKSSRPRLTVTWSTPRNKKPHPIDPANLYHDALAN